MAKHPRSKAKGQKSSGETRAADTLTVVWVMLTLTTLLCELSTAAAATLARTMASPSVQVLSQLLFFAALVAGITGLIILPFVLRIRRQPPPQVVVVASVVTAGVSRLLPAPPPEQLEGTTLVLAGFAEREKPWLRSYGLLGLYFVVILLIAGFSRDILEAFV